MTMHPISNNGFSVDDQIIDAMSWLEDNHPEAHAEILVKFPEFDRAVATITGTSSWIDPEEAGVDPEFMSWVADAIEGTGFVRWNEGEPWAEGNPAVAAVDL